MLISPLHMVNMAWKNRKLLGHFRRRVEDLLWYEKEVCIWTKYVYLCTLYFIYPHLPTNPKSPNIWREGVTRSFWGMIFSVDHSELEIEKKCNCLFCLKTTLITQHRFLKNVQCTLFHIMLIYFITFCKNVFLTF